MRKVFKLSIAGAFYLAVMLGLNILWFGWASVSSGIVGTATSIWDGMLTVLSSPLVAMLCCVMAAYILVVTYNVEIEDEDKTDTDNDTNE